MPDDTDKFDVVLAIFKAALTGVPEPFIGRHPETGHPYLGEIDQQGAFAMLEWYAGRQIAPALEAARRGQLYAGDEAWLNIHSAALADACAEIAKVATEPASHAYSEVSRWLQEARAAYPHLTRFGFGTYRDDAPTPNDELLSDEGVAEFARAVDWLSRGARTKHCKANSYELKHAAERSEPARYWRKPYISAGALIAAAHALGFKVVRKGPDGLINFAPPRRAFRKGGRYD